MTAREIRLMQHLAFPLLLLTISLCWPAPSFAQTKLTADDFVDALRVAATPIDIDVKEIHERALERIKKSGQKPQDRPALVEELNKQPQLILDIQFNTDSAIVRPESFQTLGRLADALYHPYLLDRKILVVDHIEATGKRQNNLELSQKRANAIREALVTTFRISPQRVLALGLGEEQLQDRAKAGAGANRRVQVIVIGKR
ncbi:MAG: OmpA family protein [Pseudorhodoplanes sp.]|jgi:outer membrane protein OmpA-like peptidoglycan-associated protein|nr:OmpA family protein [Pseudorhodoplanes sp.]